MKSLTTILLVALCAFSQKIVAQTYDCGITYSYDNAGNRIQRAEYLCGSGGRPEMLVVSDTTKIDSLSSQKLTETLYPNPTSGIFYVVFNNNVDEAQLIITDNLGRQLYSTVISGTTIPLDISAFAQGMYFITVKTGGNKYTNGVFKN